MAPGGAGGAAAQDRHPWRWSHQDKGRGGQGVVGTEFLSIYQLVANTQMSSLKGTSEMSDKELCELGFQARIWFSFVLNLSVWLAMQTGL